MLKKKSLFIIYTWFFASALFCLLIDLIMPTFVVNPEFNNKVLNFDEAVANQTIYFSVWVNFLTGFWFGKALVNLKNKPSFTKQSFTMITTFNIAICLIYFGGFILNRAMISGFDTWWKISKAMLEHLVNPVLIVLFYFSSKTTVIKTKQYAKKDAWKVMLLPMVYLMFIILRAVIIHEQVKTTIPDFPYPGFSPYDLPWYLFLVLGILLLGFYFMVAIGINFLSNIIVQKFYWQDQLNFLTTNPVALDQGSQKK